jgi:hypothetical protein
MSRRQPGREREREREKQIERWRLYGANKLVTGALNPRAEAVGSARPRRPPSFLPHEGEADGIHPWLLRLPPALSDCACEPSMAAARSRAFTYVSPRYFLRCPDGAHAAINPSRPGVDRVRGLILD